MRAETIIEATWRLLLTAITLAWWTGCASAPAPSKVVRVGVIGGFIRSGLWTELAKRFEAERNYRIELVLSGNRDLVADAFARGDLDFAAIHAGETASNLVAQGFARNMRVWTRNEFVIIGPRGDPAGIRGWRDGAEALRRIAKTESRLVDYQNSGPLNVLEALAARGRVRLKGEWLLETESDSSETALAFAHKMNAYLILGRVPKLPADLEILVRGDAEMRRDFVCLEANPTRVKHANAKGARSLADFLLSQKTRQFLAEFAAKSPEGVPVFSPATDR